MGLRPPRIRQIEVLDEHDGGELTPVEARNQLSLPVRMLLEEPQEGEGVERNGHPVSLDVDAGVL